MSSGILEETQDCPVKTSVHALDLNLDNQVSIVQTKFANKVQFIITETGKTNVLFEVTDLIPWLSIGTSIPGDSVSI